MRIHRFLSAVLLSGSATLLLAQPGTLDHSYNAVGYRVFPIGAADETAYGIATMADGSAVLCGATVHNGNNELFVMHVLTDATQDASFGTDVGHTLVPLGLMSLGFDVAVTPGGKILVCGVTYTTTTTASVLLVQFTSAGQLDAGFGDGGIVTTAVGDGFAEGRAIALQSDGKIVVGGSRQQGGFRDPLLLRYLPDGTLDNGFSGDGQVVLSAYATDDALEDIALLSDGSIVGAGSVDIQGDLKTLLVKVSAAGAPVSSFGGDGELVPGFGATAHWANAVLVQGTSFFAAGTWADVSTDADTYLAKFNADGSAASGFGSNGVVVTNTNPNETAYGLALQDNGKIVLCGTSGQPGVTAARDLLLERYTTDGQLDAGFGSNGVTLTSINSGADDANDVAIQPDGRILIAGFTTGAVTKDVLIARYLGDVPNAIAENTATPADLHLFPVPTDGSRLQLRVGDALRGEATVTVLDALGRTFGSPLVVRLSGSTVDLPTEVLRQAAPGVYHVRLLVRGAAYDVPFVLAR